MRLRESKEYDYWTERTIKKQELVGYTEEGRAIHKIISERTVRKRYIKKNGLKWTSWRGHCYVYEFPGSENITFEDIEPTRVEVRIIGF